MQPFDYRLQVQDPFTSAVRAIQLGQSMRDLDVERQQAMQAQQRQQQLMEAMERIHSPDATYDDYQRLSMMLPAEQAKSVRETWSQRSDIENKNELQFTGQVFSAFRAKKPEIAIGILDQKIAALENSGKTQSANVLKSWRDVAKVDPQSAEDFFGNTLTLIPGGDKVLSGALDIQKLGAEPETGFRPVTEAERRTYGLPAGVPFQVGPKGEIKEVTRGPLASVTVDTGKRDTLALKELDIPRAKEFSDAAASARGLAQTSRVVSNLLKGAGGGRLIKLTTELKRDLGFESDTVSANDLAYSLGVRGATQIRAPGSGSTSDLEFRAYVQAFPSLANSESGREIMAKYAEAFAKRSARLADHARKLIRSDSYTEEEMARFDQSLGPLLGEDFYGLIRGRRPGVPQYQAPAQAPATAAPAQAPRVRGSVRQQADEILRGGR